MRASTAIRKAFSLAAGFAFLLALSAVVAGASAKAGVLETIRSRGHLVCGVGDGPKGYSAVSENGTWAAISVDFCRALAAAVLGNKDAVKFLPLAANERSSALQSGEVDILSRDATFTPSHDTGLGIRFPGILVYDGQALHGAQGRRVSPARWSCRVPASASSRRRRTRRASPAISARSRCRSTSSSSTSGRMSVAAYTNKGCQVLSADASVLAQRQQFTDPERAPHPAGDRRQAPGRAGGATGRRGLVQRRALDALCADRRRGARHHQRQRRHDEGFRQRRRAQLPWCRYGLWASAWGSAPTGRSASSSRSATTAKCSSAI